ncbi:MAG TPA: energy transducer TonB [Gemmatimonadaceae bacterium]|nr:energy transducer TonB [Gemmatimonadaceae bacterium]
MFTLDPPPEGPHRLLLGLAIAALIFPGALRAQNDSPLRGSAECLSAIPADAMRRVTVYLAADASDSATRMLLGNLGVLTQAVAERTRTLMGAPPGTLPKGEPAITWQTIGSGLTITAHRGGRLTFGLASDRDSTTSSALLERALKAVVAADNAWFLWPDSTRDSLVFRLTFHEPFFNRSGDVHPVSAQNAIPVFSVMRPWEEQTRVIRRARVHYPSPLESGRIEGVVVMRFVVDTAGRVDLGTVRDLWPADRPRPSGEMAGYYRSFVTAVRSALVNERFEPARIGGCPVPQLVQMPFTFKP